MTEHTNRPKTDVNAITNHHRMRRNRKSNWSRRLVSENQLSVDDFIWPLFLTDGEGESTPIPSMPEVYRHTVDHAPHSTLIPVMAMMV